VPESIQFSVVYRDTDTGVAWSLDSYGNPASFGPVDVIGWLDGLNTAILAQSHNKVKLDHVSYRPIETKGVTRQISGNDTGWSNNVGSIAAAHIPQASRYFLLKGVGGPTSKGWSNFKIHGIPDEQLNASGEWTQANYATVVMQALTTLLQYRLAPTPKKNYPTVFPPNFFDSFQCNGLPYERKLGVGFLVPGVQRRYSRADSVSPAA
jgi:hypothetical protein